MINNNKTASSKFYTIPQPTLDFVGRTSELEQIHELCNQGCIPLVHAMAGTGKSHLAFAYAKHYSDEYVAGCFMIPMEGITEDMGWSTAIRRFLQGRNNEGCSMAQHIMGSQANQTIISEEGNFEEISTACIQQSINWICEQTRNGRILLLLDNLECLTLLSVKELQTIFPHGFKNISIIATSRETGVFPGKSPVRSFELKNLDEKISLHYLSSFAPFKNDDDRFAAQNIIKLIDCHAWSLEIIASRMAQNVVNGYYYSDELDYLSKNSIEKHGSELRLLMPTIEILENSRELGDEIIKLLCLITTLPYRGMPIAWIEQYWVELFSDKVCSKGKAWLYVLNTMKDFHLITDHDQTLSLHHLAYTAMNGIALMGSLNNHLF